MGNTIKRNTTKMTIQVIADGNVAKGSVIELQKDYDGWHGGGYMWLVGILRNNNFVKILSQD